MRSLAPKWLPATVGSIMLACVASAVPASAHQAERPVQSLGN
jgi:hypothetical protein